MKICRQKLLLCSLSVLGLSLLFFGGLTKPAKAEIATSSVVWYYNYDSGEELNNHYAPTTWTLTEFESGGTSVQYTSSGKFNNAIESTNNTGDSAAGSGYYYYENLHHEWETPATFSYSFWYKTSAAPSNFASLLTTWSALSIRYFNNGTLKLDYRDASNNWASSDCASFMSADDEWHNVIVQGTQGGTIDFYSDGEVVCENVSMSDLGDYSDNGYILGFMGNHIYGGSESIAYAFRGGLDDFALFDRELSTTEIAALQTKSLEQYVIDGDGTTCVRPYEDIDGICVRDPNNNYSPIIAGSAWYSVYQDPGQILNFYYSYRTDYGIMSGDYIKAYLCDEITATTTNLSDICTEPIIFWDNTIDATSTQMRIIPTSGYEPPTFLRNNTYFQMIDPGFTIATTSEYVIRDILVVPIWHATSSVPLVGQDNLFTVWWYPENSTSTALVWSPTLKPTDSPHDMACSAEEWASGDWWVNIKCGFFSTAISISYTFTDMISAAVYSTGDAAKIIFPFNIIANFVSSWTESETATLPNELDWIDFTDGEGNVYVNVPAAWAGTTTPLLIWGTDVFVPDGSPQETFFGHLRTLLKYLFFVAFLYALYELGHDIYDEVAFEEHQAKRRKEDLQL